jgi:hypothetical protein
MCVIFSIYLNYHLLYVYCVGISQCTILSLRGRVCACVFRLTWMIFTFFPAYRCYSVLGLSLPLSFPCFLLTLRQGMEEWLYHINLGTLLKMTLSSLDQTELFPNFQCRGTIQALPLFRYLLFICAEKAWHRIKPVPTSQDALRTLQVCYFFDMPIHTQNVVLHTCNG